MQVLAAADGTGHAAHDADVFMAGQGDSGVLQSGLVQLVLVHAQLVHVLVVAGGGCCGGGGCSGVVMLVMMMAVAGRPVIDADHQVLQTQRRIAQIVGAVQLFHFVLGRLLCAAGGVGFNPHLNGRIKVWRRMIRLHTG